MQSEPHSPAERGIEPTKQETYNNGVRKVEYRDPDGNEVGFGGLCLVTPGRQVWTVNI